MGELQPELQPRLGNVSAPSTAILVPYFLANPVHFGCQFFIESSQSNPHIRLSVASVDLPNGKHFEHYVFRMRRCAMTVVLDEPGEGLMLIWRHRFIVDRWDRAYSALAQSQRMAPHAAQAPVS